MSDTAPGDPDRRRGRTTVRRALLAGLVVWVVLGGTFLAGIAAGGGGGPATVSALLLGLLAAAVTCSAWLLAALVADLLTDRRPSRGLLIGTAAAVAFTFVVPILIVGATG